MISKLTNYKSRLSKTDHENNYFVMVEMVKEFGENDVFHRNYSELNIINGSEITAQVKGVLGTQTPFKVNPDEWYYIDEKQYINQLDYDVICDLIDDTIFELEN